MTLDSFCAAMFAGALSVSAFAAAGTAAGPLEVEFDTSGANVLDDAMYLSKTPPQGSWRTFNYWHWHEKELTIAEALKRDVRSRSVPGGDSDMKRIDYIYVTPGTEVLDFRTVSSPRPGSHDYPSDHFPTVATVVSPDR